MEMTHNITQISVVFFFACWVIFHAFVVVCCFVSKSPFSKTKFRNSTYIRESNDLDTDLNRRSVVPDMGQNCLRRIATPLAWKDLNVNIGRKRSIFTDIGEKWNQQLRGQTNISGTMTRSIAFILTHISLASFLWDICRQCRYRSDAVFSVSTACL